MMEAWYLLQKEKKVFLPPHFSFDYKTVAVSSQGTTFSCLPACKPCKHPILTNPLLSTNFASHWILSELRHKGLRYRSSSQPSEHHTRVSGCLALANERWEVARCQHQARALRILVGTFHLPQERQVSDSPSAWVVLGLKTRGTDPQPTHGQPPTA